MGLPVYVTCSHQATVLRSPLHPPARPPALQRGLTTRDCAGGRRSGKSSIQKVVFYKMSPHETLFLENTHRVQISGVPRHPCSLGLFFFDARRSPHRELCVLQRSPTATSCNSKHGTSRARRTCGSALSPRGKGFLCRVFTCRPGAVRSNASIGPAAWWQVTDSRFATEAVFGGCSALLFVIDAQVRF